jgi:hypothetical protein
MTRLIVRLMITIRSQSSIDLKSGGSRPEIPKRNNLKCGHSISKTEDYPASLEVCWQQHLKPKAEDAPTVISLSAGCVGSSLGYSMAGYRERQGKSLLTP